jgi:hypothetical protein
MTSRAFEPGKESDFVHSRLYIYALYANPKAADQLRRERADALTALEVAEKQGTDHDRKRCYDEWERRMKECSTTELTALAPLLAGAPVLIEHAGNDPLVDPPLWVSGVDGRRNVGEVWSQWQDPSTGTLFVGLRLMDTTEGHDQCRLLERGVHNGISLGHTRIPVDTSDRWRFLDECMFRVDEVSLCWRGLRPGTQLVAIKDAQYPPNLKWTASLYKAGGHGKTVHFQQQLPPAMSSVPIPAGGLQSLASDGTNPAAAAGAAPSAPPPSTAPAHGAKREADQPAMGEPNAKRVKTESAANGVAAMDTSADEVASPWNNESQVMELVDLIRSGAPLPVEKQSEILDFFTRAAIAHQEAEGGRKRHQAELQKTLAQLEQVKREGNYSRDNVMTLLEKLAKFVGMGPLTPSAMSWARQAPIELEALASRASYAIDNGALQPLRPPNVHADLDEQAAKLKQALSGNLRGRGGVAAPSSNSAPAPAPAAAETPVVQSKASVMHPAAMNPAPAAAPVDSPAAHTDRLRAIMARGNNSTMARQTLQEVNEKRLRDADHKG